MNQSSNSSHLGVGTYSISKLARNGLTLSLAQELAPDDAERSSSTMPTRSSTRSHRASFVTGQTVTVDGGFVKRI